MFSRSERRTLIVWVWLDSFWWEHPRSHWYSVFSFLSSCSFFLPFLSLLLYLFDWFSVQTRSVAQGFCPTGRLTERSDFAWTFFDSLAPFDVQFWRCFCSPNLRESFVLSNAMPKHSDKPAEFYVGLDEMHTVVRERENCVGSLEVLELLC